MHGDFDLGNAVFHDLDDGEGEATVVDHFLLLEEITLQVKQESCYGLGLLGMFAQLFLVDVEHACEVA